MSSQSFVVVYPVPDIDGIRVCALRCDAVPDFVTLGDHGA
jgi:hypothetical protein